MRRPSVKTKCVADHFSTDRERIIEFSSAKGGGLVSFHMTDTELLISPYRLDKTVRVVNGSMPAIRFIAQTFTSERDRYGNCSHWTRVTSTLTGRSLAVADCDGENNVQCAIKRALGDGADAWIAVLGLQTVVPRKQFKSPAAAIFESDLTADLILALEDAP